MKRSPSRAASQISALLVVALAAAMVLGAGGLTRAVAGEVTTTVYSIADTYVDEGLPTKNYGGLDLLWIGGPNHQRPGGPPIRQRCTLVKFDFSTIPNLPFVSCTLRLRACARSGDEIDWAQMHYVTSNWDENTVTWQTRPGTEPVLGSPQLTGPQPQSWWSGSVLTPVLEWLGVSQPQRTNYGLMIAIPQLYTEDARLAFRSREWTTPSARPQIVIVQQTMGG